MPSKLELAFCVVPGQMIDVFDIHTGVHLRSIHGTMGECCTLHDSFIICGDNAKPILSVYNHRLNQFKWKVVIPKETKITSIAITDDSRFLLVGTSKGHLYCWCLLTGKLLKIITAHLQAITAIRITADGAGVLTGSMDCLMKLYKLAHIVIPTNIHSTANSNTNTNANVNGNKNTNDNMIPNNWNVSSVSEIYGWNDHILGITDILVNKCDINSKIYSGSLDCSVKIYDLLSKECLYTIQFSKSISKLAINGAFAQYLLVTTKFGQFYKIEQKLLDNTQNSINIVNATINDIKNSEKNVKKNSIINQNNTSDSHNLFRKSPTVNIQHIIEKDPKTVLYDITYENGML